MVDGRITEIEFLQITHRMSAKEAGARHSNSKLARLGKRILTGEGIAFGTIEIRAR